MRASWGSKFVRGFGTFSGSLATIALLFMMIIIVANIIGRVFLRSPLTGVIELSGFAGLVFVAVAIVFTEAEKRNVVVDFVVSQIPSKIRKVLDHFTSFLSLGAVGLLFYAVLLSTIRSFQDGERTLTLSINTFPFWLIWGIGIMNLFICILLHLIKLLVTRGNQKI
ncbi:MAG: TRAP transporter small permease [Desulfobacteraceae bacterium]|nr:MAG: TRAP transporter small permease [Desulfobacteraceae bacterium]